ncbi:protein FAM169B-like [Takifugu rubripes]|uniref:protein FAM169B-like n=1 Tax=Takifugu rubripes TaxID=31033 RepID=UPI0011454BBE|nr:protein FAM169B-like [Takifugu rubripes]
MKATHAVQSIVERVILFLLSRVVDRTLDESVCFSLHPRTESCSLLWRDGQAIGFYTVKHKGVKVCVLLSYHRGEGTWRSG